MKTVQEESIAVTVLSQEAIVDTSGLHSPKWATADSRQERPGASLSHGWPVPGEGMQPKHCRQEAALRGFSITYNRLLSS